jgi:hypothetical protein
VLDDRNLFIECKEKNPKLIAYLSRKDNLKTLLDFALGNVGPIDDNANAAK